ncbi:MAG TPA: hypothetical protein PKA64_14680 [Myxococcota bacterium]|nr:hypothetical protein [Myxococcota bacterium]
MRWGVLLVLGACAGPAAEEPDDELAWPEAGPPARCPAWAAAVVGGVGYASVQGAIDDAFGAPVTVCRGTRQVNLRHRSSDPLYLQGETSRWSDTVLDGGLAGPVLAGDASITTQALYIRNLAIVDGAGAVGPPLAGDTAGGVTLNSVDGSLYLDHVAFRGNTSPGSGGAVASRARRVVMRAVILDHNRAGNCGGGAYLNPQRGAITLRDVRFLGNEAALNCGGLGLTAGELFGPSPGGIDVLVEGGELSDNRADAGAGAWVDLVTTGAVTFRGVTVAGNAAATSYGGLNLQGFGGAGRSFTLEDVRLIDNEAPSLGALSLVGLSPVNVQTFDVAGGEITSNRSGGDGAIHLAGRARAVLTDVDLGAGPTDNDHDVGGCGAGLGAGTSGVIDPAAGDRCP